MAQRPSERRHAHHIWEEHLNIIPVMNLFILLIPFLLLSAVFVQIGIIETTLPKISTTPITSGENLKKITLTCTINDKGFVLRGINPTIRLTREQLKEEYLSSKGVLLEKTKEKDYNFKELNSLLKRIKDNFPDEDTIFILPETYVIYDNIIKTMDSSRQTYLKSPTPEAKIIKSLFPNAVIAGNID